MVVTLKILRLLQELQKHILGNIVRIRAVFHIVQGKPEYRIYVLFRVAGKLLIR